jgi:hypothetical protein
VRVRAHIQMWGVGVSAGNTIGTQSGRECRTWCRRDGGILAWSMRLADRVEAKRGNRGVQEVASAVCVLFVWCVYLVVDHSTKQRPQYTPEKTYNIPCGLKVTPKGRQ